MSCPNINPKYPPTLPHYAAGFFLFSGFMWIWLGAFVN